MKYSIYVRNRLKREIIKNNPHISEEEANEKATKEFKDMLLESFYQAALANLNDNDSLKTLELEGEFRFSDVRYEITEKESSYIRNPYFHLFHGVRMDENHEIFESILRDKKIKCANQTNLYWRGFGDENCNEGKYVSLIHYSGEDYDVEFQTFIEENVSFIISHKLNPIKCKYLPYDEWKQIKKKLPKTKNRYSYARHEYQYPDCIPFDYVEGILYPLKYYNHTKGFIKTQEDLKYVRKLLKKYGLEDLPILDPTDRFKIIEEEPDIHLLHRHPSLLGKI